MKQPNNRKNGEQAGEEENVVDRKNMKEGV
jgi:hypothetical protein